jgi:hypothetical protein
MRHTQMFKPKFGLLDLKKRPSEDPSNNPSNNMNLPKSTFSHLHIESVKNSNFKVLHQQINFSKVQKIKAMTKDLIDKVHKYVSL